MPSRSHAAPFWAIALAFGVLYVAWGTTYLAIQWGVRDERLPAFYFGGTRIGAAGVLLLAFQRLRGIPVRPRAGDLYALAVVSVLLFVMGNGLLTLAQKKVDSGMAAILAATTPLWLGLFGVVWPHGERLGTRGWLGLAVGLGGVVVLLWPELGDLDGFLHEPAPFLVLASAASWALGSLVLKSQRTSRDHLTVAGQQLVCGGLFMCGIGFAARESWPETITVGAATAFLYLLIVGSLMGFVAFNWLLGHVSANKVGTYAYVNPAVAVLVGWAAGEAVTPAVVAGIGIILFGVFLVRGGEARPTLPGEEAAGDVLI